MRRWITYFDRWSLMLTNVPYFLLLSKGSKDGKTAWKLRKQAIDEVDAAVNKCSALIDTSSIKQYVELLRALRDRLSDSQGNLKPLAARVIGNIFSAMDKAAQAKLGKLVFAPLITATMTDIKKPMREASLEALRQATTIPSIEGGGLNEDVLDSFTNALASEINDTALKVCMFV
jgi:cytoskeleton-associated protein 5